MSNKTKSFSLRAILTVTTGRLLTESKGPHDNGIGDLYELLGWMTNDSPMTHQLGRFAEECKPCLYRWFPELGIAEASLDNLDGWLARDKTSDKSEAVKMWLAELKMMLPSLKDSYEVPRITGHEQRCPVEEMAQMIGEENIITVIA